ncbi:MAG TPA: DMT family transporter [Chitinophagales bacterium]|nr:DMT family transporter [Chitinophagales bacterium]
MNRSVRAHLFLLIVNLFYGAGFTVTKMVMPEFIKPFGFILIRVSITTTLFFILHWFWLKEKVEKKDFLLLMACGMFGVVINQEMFFKGLSITTPINAALIMIMTPILVFVISFFLSHEKATWQKITGLVIGLSGALVILAGKGFNFSSDTLLGDLFILINATSYAIYLVMVRPLMKKYHPLTVIKWVFLFGLIPVTLFGYRQLGEVQWHTFTAQTWAATAFVVVCTTFLAYLLNMLALREVHSSVVGAYIYLQPAIATIISISLGKDVITFEKVLSAVLIFSGVYLVSFAGGVKLFNRPDKEPDSDDMILE